MGNNYRLNLYESGEEVFVNNFVNEFNKFIHCYTCEIFCFLTQVTVKRFRANKMKSIHSIF